jgi:putative endonuclease
MYMKQSFVYILTNRHRTVFYIGVTANLENRMIWHRAGKGSIFCKKYNVNILIYYKIYLDINDAIQREKVLKKWNRIWKIELIKKRNPEMKDLSGKD